MTTNVNPMIQPCSALTEITTRSIFPMSRTNRIPILTKWSPTLAPHTGSSLLILCIKNKKLINDIINKLGGTFKRYFDIAAAAKVLKTKENK